MKKAFAWTTVAFCAAAMCVSLVACGEGENAGDVDAESIVGHEVTEAQWDAAFDELLSAESVYTVRGKLLITLGYISSDNELAASATEEFSGFSVKNGRQEHLKIELRYTDLSGDSEKLYGGYSNRFFFGFNFSDEKTNLEKTYSLEYYYNFDEKGNDFYEKGWGKNEWKCDHYNGKGERSEVGGQIERLADACKGNLTMFHYDSEKKGYVTTEEIAEFSPSAGAQYTVIKFDENGKLVALLTDGESENSRYSYSTTYQFAVEYTAEEIVFPTDYIEN